MTLTSQDNSITQTITTPSNIPASVNQKDNYFFQSVPVTNYTAIATGPTNPNGKLEYSSATGAKSAAPDAPNDKGFAVPSSPTVDGVNFTLTPILATISGRIFDITVGDSDAGGTKMAGATVTLADSAGKVIATTTAAGARTVPTDPAPGSYTFANVPGTTTGANFSVNAAKAGFNPNSKAINGVFLGDVLVGQDVGLTPIPPGILTGTVIDSASGAGVAGALVNFTSSDGTVTLPQAIADAAGNYTIPGVPPEKNLKGLSFAVANTTGVLAAILARQPGDGSPAEKLMRAIDVEAGL